jgi:hypothetical protein
MNYKHFIIIVISFLALFTSTQSCDSAEDDGSLIEETIPVLDIKNLDRTIEEFKTKPYEKNSFTTMQGAIDGFISLDKTPLWAEDKKIQLYHNIVFRLTEDAIAHIKSGSGNSALIISHLNEIGSTVYAKNDPKNNLASYIQRIKAIDHYCHSMPAIVETKISNGSLLYDATTVDDNLYDDFLANTVNNLSSIDVLDRNVSRIVRVRNSCLNKLETYRSNF